MTNDVINHITWLTTSIHRQSHDKQCFMAQ